jgi:hypothetical protein
MISNLNSNGVFQLLKLLAGDECFLEFLLLLKGTSNELSEVIFVPSKILEVCPIKPIRALVVGLVGRYRVVNLHFPQ